MYCIFLLISKATGAMYLISVYFGFARIYPLAVPQNDIKTKITRSGCRYNKRLLLKEVPFNTAQAQPC